MHRFTVILMIALAMLAPTAHADDRLVITNPWSPEAPPGRTMAGFMHLTNEGAEAIVLAEASSEQFDRVEIHQMSMEDGVMRMRRIEELRIESDQTVELRSGGYHLMLFGPRQQYRAGDELAVELIGRNGQSWAVKVNVKSRQFRN